MTRKNIRFLGTPLIFLGIVFTMVIFRTQTMVFAQSGDTENSTVCFISEPKTDKFPEISTEFRAFDQQYNNITGLTGSKVQITDNGKAASIVDLVSKENGIGADIYFVVDQGNRTNQAAVHAVLKRFGEKIMINGVDRVAILTDKVDSRRNIPNLLLPPTSSVAEFVSSVNNLPADSEKNYLKGYDAHIEALNLIRGESEISCGRPRFLISIMGDDVITEKEAIKISSLALQLKTPVYVVHIGRYNAYQSASIYEQLAKLTYGQYIQIGSFNPVNFTQLDPNVFATITKSRQTYSVKYYSRDGTSGSHTINLQLNSLPSTNPIPAQYTVTITPPIVTITIPADGVVITRTATQQIDKGFIFDVDTHPVQFAVEWSDGYPRKIVLAELLVQTQLGIETVASIVPSEVNILEFDWDMRALATEGDNPVVLQVKTTDELGYQSVSQPVNVIVRNSIPSSLTLEATNPFLRYLLYGLVVIVILLTILVIVFWRRLSVLASKGVIGQVVNQVRKTIIGGWKRGKPIAMLKVIDGPANLVGKELPIYSENVKLGRDPAQADFTFYENANSTISGLHARLERVNHSWRLVAVSKSGSETFLDDQPLPMMSPAPIHDGQVIRLGYPAQQCVELEFHVNESQSLNEDYPVRDTKAKISGDTEVDLPVPIAKGNFEPDPDMDDIFKSLRERKD